MSLIETYKQLLAEYERIRLKYGSYDEGYGEALAKAEGFALACQQELKHSAWVWNNLKNAKTKERYYDRIRQLEAVVELAKQQGHLK